MTVTADFVVAGGGSIGEGGSPGRSFHSSRRRGSTPGTEARSARV